MPSTTDMVHMVIAVEVQAVLEQRPFFWFVKNQPTTTTMVRFVRKLLERNGNEYRSTITQLCRGMYDRISPIEGIMKIRAARAKRYLKSPRDFVQPL